MAGSEQQDDERRPQPAPADALRDAVERTFRDAAGALQRLAGPPAGDAPGAEALAALTARLDAIDARLAALEAAAAKPAAKRAPARRCTTKQPAKRS